MNEDSILDPAIASHHAREFISSFAPAVEMGVEYPGTWYDVVRAREADMLSKCVGYLEKTHQLRKHPTVRGAVQFLDSNSTRAASREDSQACFCG